MKYEQPCIDYKYRDIHKGWDYEDDLKLLELNFLKSSLSAAFLLLGQRNKFRVAGSLEYKKQ